MCYGEGVSVLDTNNGTDTGGVSKLGGAIATLIRMIPVPRWCYIGKFSGICKP